MEIQEHCSSLLKCKLDSVFFARIERSRLVRAFVSLFRAKRRKGEGGREKETRTDLGPNLLRALQVTGNKFLYRQQQQLRCIL